MVPIVHGSNVDMLEMDILEEQFLKTCRSLEPDRILLPEIGDRRSEEPVKMNMTAIFPMHHVLYSTLVLTKWVTDDPIYRPMGKS